jgi:hypothetical protein
VPTKTSTGKRCSVAGYQAQRQTLQRNQYVVSFRNWDTKTTGIGPPELATLASYDIETAADVYNPQQTAAECMELGKIHADIEHTARGLQDEQRRARVQLKKRFLDGLERFLLDLVRNKSDSGSSAIFGGVLDGTRIFERS